jgi:hypothetical protein
MALILKVEPEDDGEILWSGKWNVITETLSLMNRIETAGKFVFLIHELNAGGRACFSWKIKCWAAAADADAETEKVVRSARRSWELLRTKHFIRTAAEGILLTVCNGMRGGTESVAKQCKLDRFGRSCGLRPAAIKQYLFLCG